MKALVLRSAVVVALGLVFLACGRDPLLDTPRVGAGGAGAAGSGGRGATGGRGGADAGGGGASDTGRDVMQVPDVQPGQFQLVVLPNPGPALPRGSSVRFRALVQIDGDWRDLNADPSIDFQTDDPAIADVTPKSGRVMALTVGRTVLRVTHPLFREAAVPIVVTGLEVRAVEIEPAPLAFMIGEKTALRAEAIYADNSTADVTAAAVWETGDQRIVRVENRVPPLGEATAIAAGTTALAAEFAGIRGTVTATVSGSAGPTLAVEPKSTTRPVGSTVRFQAALRQPTGAATDVSNSASWSSSNPTVASALGSGQFRCLAMGTVTVRVAHVGLAASAELTCQTGAVTLRELRISPSGGNAPLLVNTRYRLMLEAIFTDGSTTPVTGNSPRWQSSNPAVATIDDSATLTGLVPGMAAITVTYGGLSASETYSFIAR